MSAHIKVDPPLQCCYIAACTNLASKAIIYKAAAVPLRWIMIPVCPACFHSAVLEYDPDPIHMTQLKLTERNSISE